MDNICHTLVGGAFAQAGLKRRSAFATATLLIAANLPDVDVLAIPLGNGLGWRRGVTHGVPALVLWPFVLVGVVMLWARLRAGKPDRVLEPGALLVLAALGVWSHPLLDYLNVYGMRWLMPISPRWYYGDSLFIVDPWLLLLLGGGIWAAWRAERAGRADWFRPARLALAIAAIYISGMIGTTLIAQAAVARTEAGDPLVTGIRMVAPVPINPFRRQIISDRGHYYRLGTFRLLPWPQLVWNQRVDKGPIADPAVIAAARTEDGATFLRWARLPVARILTPAASSTVEFYDLRYSDGTPGSWASVMVSVQGAPSR